MKGVAAVLLLAAVGCHAGVITIHTEGYPEVSTLPGSSFFLTSAGPGQPVETVEVDLNGNPQAYSSVFTNRRANFFDTGLSAWLEQQIAALDQMQAALDQAPRPRTPCSRSGFQTISAAGGAQASRPDMLAYMASSRFGPAFISSLAEQDAEDGMDADMMPEATDMEDMPSGSMADWNGEGFMADGSGGFITISSFSDEYPRDGRGFEPSMLAEEDGYPMYSPYVETEAMRDEDLPVEEDVAGPAWFFVLEDGSLNWGLIVFAGLLLAVVPLWCHVFRAAAKLSSCRQRRAQRSQEQFMVSASQPLLGKAFLQPLVPEKPMAEKACPIEIATEHIPEGRNDFVTIAYVPLKGEQ